MRGIAGAGALGIIIIGGLYFLPSIIAATRKVVNVGSVVAINLLLGWTLIGWVIALAMALRTNPPHAYPQYWQQSGQEPHGDKGLVTQSPPADRGAGWKQDPWGVPDQRRYWDGRAWTREAQPRGG